MGRRGPVLVLLLVASSATAGPDSAAFQAIIDDDGAVIGTSEGGCDWPGLLPLPRC